MIQSKKNIVIIDANVILRYLLSDINELYEKSKIFFGEVSKGNIKAYISHAVLAEVVYVLIKVYKIGRSEVSSVLVEFISQKSIIIEDKDIIIESLDIFSNSNCDYVDCILCSYSKKYKVFSFDKDVTKFAGKNIFSI
ncbi:MAG TPA: PIN domain-containing protein [Spirochaetota bacterium]|nr:PIN domain-containing protein [Spirochaetota bacterium]HOK92265.1 PIN domain-containing protein [Spirochaetota bacterium]HPP95178.1 PIN domain-containing protein [Spirochaetota bacterium]